MSSSRVMTPIVVVSWTVGFVKCGAWVDSEQPAQRQSAIVRAAQKCWIKLHFGLYISVLRPLAILSINASVSCGPPPPLRLKSVFPIAWRPSAARRVMRSNRLSLLREQRFNATPCEPSRRDNEVTLDHKGCILNVRGGFKPGPAVKTMIPWTWFPIKIDRAPAREKELPSGAVRRHERNFDGERFTPILAYAISRDLISGQPGTAVARVGYRRSECKLPWATPTVQTPGTRVLNPR